MSLYAIVKVRCWLGLAFVNPLFFLAGLCPQLRWHIFLGIPSDLLFSQLTSDALARPR